jgi:hypothetical protein
MIDHPIFDALCRAAATREQAEPARRAVWPWLLLIGALLALVCVVAWWAA